MKVIIATAFSCIIFPVLIHAQSSHKTIDCIPKNLPLTLKLLEPRPVKYQVTIDYFNQDIFGNFINKNEVSGLYTRGLSGGKAQWNNVRIANSDKREGAFPEGSRQNYMENLQYATETAATDTSIFKNFPVGDLFGKNLVWDMFTFESFAWLYFDSLQLNIPYHARAYNVNVPLAGTGNFINRDVKLTWSGISRMNGRLCVLIQFEAMDNLLTIKTEAINAKGRSHYWGNIWVSLDDKQLEGAWMNEDVILEVNFSGNKQLINTVRKLKIEKTKD